MTSQVVAKNKKHLQELIKRELELKGATCSLNHIDVSHITDMTYLFYGSKFNGDLSAWDVSHVVHMGWMFKGSKFNKDIDDWNTSNVVNMCEMFNNSLFAGEIGSWDVSKVRDMNNMFNNSRFNGNLSNWNPISLQYAKKMFGSSMIELPYWYSEDVEEIKKKLNLQAHKDRSQSRDDLFYQNMSDAGMKKRV